MLPAMKHMKYVILIPLFYLSSILQAGEIWHVPADCESIQAAIDAASDGDEIQVAAGVWHERVNTVGKELYIHSLEGAEDTVIHAGERGTAVTCYSGNALVIEGFTIRGGEAELGGGVYLQDVSPTFRMCMIDFNSAKKGGGVYVQNGNPVFDQCVFSFNNAKEGDGIWAQHARPELTACIFAGDSIGWESGEMVTVRDTNSPAGACCIRGVCVQTASVACWEAGGLYQGEASTCVSACNPVCDEDVSGDGVVNMTDVLRVISAFGFCP